MVNYMIHNFKRAAGEYNVLYGDFPHSLSIAEIAIDCIC